MTQKGCGCKGNKGKNKK